MESAVHVAPDHPAFAGHFPGHPILPGVVLLAEVMAAIERATGRGPDRWTLAQAKFLHPVAPGDTLVVAHEENGTGAMRFEVRSGAVTVATGTFLPRG